ncbi:MAG: hypothetical protein QOJ15_938 [Bradyrhizobium sp.]|nr:hypothetical protein [Bradyrhizobium sp.]
MKLDRVIRQTAGSSEFAFSDLLLPGFLVVCALAGLWALLTFVIGPDLEDRVALRVAEIIEHGRRSGRQEGTSLALQKLTASVERLHDVVLARRSSNVTGNPQDTRLDRIRAESPLPPPPPPPPFDADAFAQDVISAWKFAREDLEPGPFGDTYDAIGVSAYRLGDATVLRQASGSVLHSPIWAISARHGDLYFIVPAPNLDVSELSVGGNRRANECYEGVFTVEVGETNLLQVATGHMRGSEIVVERMGLLHLPGR